MADDQSVIEKMQADILWLKTELAAATGRVHEDVAEAFRKPVEAIVEAVEPAAPVEAAPPAEAVAPAPAEPAASAGTEPAPPPAAA